MSQEDESEDQSLGRRDILKLGAAGAATLAGSKLAPKNIDLSGLKPDILKRLRHIEKDNISMPRNFLEIATGGDLKDLRYRPRHTARKVASLASSGLENSNGFQSYNPSEAFLSTRDDGTGATVTEDGRLDSFFHPYTGYSTWLPYFTHGDDELMGSVPREGSYPELEVEGELKQTCNDLETTEFGMRHNKGILDAEYSGKDIVLEESSFVVPKEETLRRDYTIKNVSDEELEIVFRYHTRANVNNNEQNFGFWHSNSNELKADEELTWSDNESGQELRIGLEDEPDSTEAESYFEGSLVDLNLDDIRDILHLEDTDSSDSVEGRFLDGDLEKELSVKPGESVEVSVMLEGNESSKLEGGSQESAEDHWQGFFSDLEMPDEMDEREEDMYRDSARILAGLHDPEKSSSAAAPNIQPLYYPTWIRDGAIQTVAKAQSGQYQTAKEELKDFMAEVQSEDGSFQQCFNPEGGLTGVWEVQNDQPSLFTWAVSEVYHETGDKDFVEEIWENVQNAQEYLIGNRAGNGLMKSAPDYSENLEDFSRQSLWTNSLAYESLKTAAELAEELNEDGAEQYRAAADEIGESTVKNFFPESEEPVSEYRLFDGAINNFGGLDSFAVWPLSFAEDYDLEDEITSILDRETDFPPGFVPGQLNYAGMLYNQDRHEEADELVDQVLDHRSKAGGLYEQIQEDGEETMAYPLGWSQAAFIMAMEKKYS
ncbi:hypothetical protein GLT92_00435 [Nanohaloarchaea archaeon]|nr:hypothetical protein [Candidatus Nanohaloarchaea archaeon]